MAHAHHAQRHKDDSVPQGVAALNSSGPLGRQLGRGPDAKRDIVRRARERRWAIIGEDGRHVWVGRHSDPTEAEITEVEAALARQGLTGFLAITEGDYWSRSGSLNFIMVRPLATPTASFDAAVAAFEAARKKRLVCVRK